MADDQLLAAKDATACPTKPIWTDETKARFVGYIDKWRVLLLMNGWQINVRFKETPHTDVDLAETCSAEITVNGAYHSGHHITIFPRMLAEPDELEQERKCLHELIHIMTHGQKDLVRRLMGDKFVTWKELTNENERSTDWIANIIWSLYDLRRE